MKTIKHWIALALCLALICSLLPPMTLTASAATYSGECGAEGDNLTWTLDTSTGVLTISGSGEMADYEEGGAPWNEYCESITSIVLPAGLTSIGWNAFSGCTGLTAISLPSGLKTIGGFAFYGCTGITGVSLPGSLTILGEFSFSRTGVTAVTIPGNLTGTGNGVFADCANLTGVTIQSGVAGVNDYAFKGCANLTELSLPASLLSIDKEAFSGCTGLTSITFPGSLVTIDEKAFFGCTGLTGVTLPDSLTKLGRRAFYGCSGLTSLNLPGSLLTVPEFAFFGCTGLTTLTLPEGMENLEESAFEGCAGLTELTIPSTLTSIGWYAFLDCPALSSVTIPETVIEVGGKAFGFLSDEYGLTTKIEDFKIIGVVGSAAQTYAEEYGFTFEPIGQVNPFVDVSENDFFFNPVMWALANQVTGGIDETHFGPERTVMRADSMVFFWAANGRPNVEAQSHFKDVKKNHWAYAAVTWAVEYGITGGTNADGTRFSPQRTCTRSEILQFLYAAMGKPEYTIENPYSDVKPKHWYKDGAIWAYEKGLERGENGKFKAKTPCTRGYVVTYLYRYFTGEDLAQ